MSGELFELWFALGPEAALVAGALVVLAVDVFVLKRETPEVRLRLASILGMVAVGFAMALVPIAPDFMAFLGGSLALDGLSSAARLGILVLALLTLGISGGCRIRNPAEYICLILFATAGFTLMAAAQQLLLIFLSLELASLSLYVLTGFSKSRPESAEAAMKYFLFGGISSAFLLFGFSLIFGLTGSLRIPAIALAISLQGFSPLLGIALVMVAVAFGFKVAAAPFHLWAPDAYQGAPAPSAALIASASKLAGFSLFFRLLWPGLGVAAGGGHGPGWEGIAYVLSGASLLVGIFGALVQSNPRRLLAYSAIAHSGTLVLALIAAGTFGPGPLIYYALTYGIAAAGCFGVIAIVERDGPCERLEDLAGLRQRSPLLAGCLLVFVLSLAGIPPLAGFFGKFIVFSAVLRLGISSPAGWLTVSAIGLSAVALYYYLQILKQAWTCPHAPERGRIHVPWTAAATLVAAAFLVVLLGVWPGLVNHAFH